MPSYSTNQIEALCNALMAATRAIETLTQPTAAQDKPRVSVAPAKPHVARPHQKWPRNNIEWAQPGGYNFAPAARTLFDTAAFRASYRPGETLASYVAVSPGMRTLSEYFSLPLAKISTCGSSRLLKRRDELNADAYGAGVKRGGELVTETGWTDWSMIQTGDRIVTSPASPVRAGDRCMLIDLPDTLGIREFEAAYDAEVSLGSLAKWINTPDGLRHCAELGLDPTHASRFTSYGYGTAKRISEAREICIFRQKAGLNRLVEIAERIILRHLGIVP